MNRFFTFTKYIFVFLLIFPSLICASFQEVDGSKKIIFPEAHGTHPEYRVEWWYFVGHLETDSKRTFGYELTFFRVGIDKEDKNSSAWSIDSTYIAHFALTDDQKNDFYHDEKTARPSFQQAGAAIGYLSVWIDKWKVSMIDNKIYLSAALEDISLDLVLTPSKNPVLHGEQGYSKKGPELGEASYYSSFTRLNGTGMLRIKDEIHSIKNVIGWMDHEVTSQDLPTGIVGWDWFAIQLDNEQEIMVYQLRNEKGEKSSFSKGSFIDKDGSLTPLTQNDFIIKPLRTWQSAETKISYPSGWEILIPKLNYKLTLTPTVLDQELTTQNTTNINYWEGRCLVEVESADKKISGVSYVELTGYGKKVEYF